MEGGGGAKPEAAGAEHRAQALARKKAHEGRAQCAKRAEAVEAPKGEGCGQREALHSPEYQASEAQAEYEDNGNEGVPQARLQSAGYDHAE